MLISQLYQITQVNRMATRKKKMRLIPHKPVRLLLLLLPRRNLFAGLAAAFAAILLLVVLVLLSMTPPSSPPFPHSSPRCSATDLGELGDIMVSMLPRDLAFTVFVPSRESFLRVLKLRPNDSDVAAIGGKAGSGNNYAVVSRVLGFSAVPRRLRSADVPLYQPVAAAILDSVSGLKISAWRDADGVLVVNGVRSECVDIVRDETVVHVMAGVLMDAEFERYFSSQFEG